MTETSTETVNPGMHPHFSDERFSADEKMILRRLSNEWLLTNSGRKLHLANSTYEYFLMKPTRAFTEMFGVERELIVVFSPYVRLEPRTFDAFDAAMAGLSDLRVERICQVLISRDPDVEARVDSLVKTDPERPIVIPFSYDELLPQFDSFYIRNRFSKHFYTRDLFAFLSPLKKDLYFFGRNDLVQDIVNRHRAGEHMGLFGLRKSGKTSIIYALERYLSVAGGKFLSIDCENPSIHKLRWNELLAKTVNEYWKLVKTKGTPRSMNDRYSEKKAADSFSADMLQACRETKSLPVMLLLDEIERISPRTASSVHWKSGDDFVYFWQTLRGFYQRHPEVFTYMLVGTNPNCVELAMIGDHENPIFASIPAQYVPAFDVSQVRDMVRKLGRNMGMKFDELVFSKLADDFGGHPFMVRQMCSALHKASTGDRPALVGKALYEKTKQEFLKEASPYFNMILQVLEEWYPDEHEMLTLLAIGDTATFNEYATTHAEYTRHLIGYGLLEASDSGYTFKIEAIKTHLNGLRKYERINMSQADMLNELSSRRNLLEKRLRRLISQALRQSVGKKKATERVLAALPGPRRDKLTDEKLGDLLGEKSPLFFLDLKNVVVRNWEDFEHVFEGLNKNKLDEILQGINDTGRPDAHAKDISADDFAQVRLHYKKLDAALNDWDA